MMNTLQSEATSIADWEMWPQEPTEAYEGFICFRDLGSSRNLTKVAETLKKPYSTIADWSSRYRWQHRVRQYVQHLDKQNVDSQIEAIIEMNCRHARLAQTFVNEVAKRLETFNELLKPLEMIRWFEVAVKIERLTLGEETDIVRQRFTQMTDAELIEYLRHNMSPELLLPAPIEEDNPEGDVGADV
jgi:hypothetical protein